ncbi:SusC/RagA family TonB-linked outer membrane protein [Flavobacterium noncentrifugens]|uniref:TonB-linked outer membrane protein, SusC/RagA family n=1 Tax=Flavobacterium noncentrifugens TaxID=1128970 RepID=A0A1G8V1U5_9FLAO|nr:SusC/RagA family TonB-linked outer membrane protein [Flavobacterium noncentrifugens]GEP50302.1 SusC/RagA family TonB-linked outer membrane protein [Flavobacterium noncentrifugens]SDJ59834.1 TonB-linked outer membrane protein, SusC/RagA family [Flavobacterium noncentrifugens]
MKLKFNGFLALLLVLITQITFAQDIAVTGVVQDQAGMPVPGANVLVKGTSNGVQTDFDGKFKISAAKGQVLVFSFLGMKTQEMPASANMTVKLADDSVQLEGVVVTALGITRDKKSLGYATQKVDGSEVNVVPNTNFVNNLSGKVAGLQVKTNNNLGGSTNVVIRGYKSIGFNNQALFVIDGIPVDNSNTNSRNQETGRYGYDYGNAAADINPADIESINVLKGAAATALYGSRAANGAIMITTKKGKEGTGFGVSFESSVSVGSIDKDTFAKYQKEYGQGYFGDLFRTSRDINGDGVADTSVRTGDDASFGPKFDGQLVYQWDSFTPESPYYRTARPWVAAKNDPIKFFQTPFTHSNTVRFDGGNDKGAFSLSYTNLSATGLMPNSEQNKNSFLGNASYKLNDKLTASFMANYINTRTLGRNGTGYNGNLVSGFRQWWATNVDVKELRDIYNATGKNYSWNPTSNTNLTPAYWNNPYFERFESYQNDTRNRILANTSLNYKLLKWLDVTGRLTVDNYSEVQEERLAVGSYGGNSFGTAQTNESSGYQRFNRNYSEFNYDLMFNYNWDITEKFNLKGVAGVNIRRQKINSVMVSTSGGLYVPNVYSLANSVNLLEDPIQAEQNRGVDGYYISASFGYDDFLFLDATARKDYSSTLPSRDNGYFYPSVSGSLVFSNLVKADWLSLGKVRIGYAEVGNDAPIYSIYDTYQKPAKFGTTLYSVNSTKNNPALKSELTRSLEAGLELQFFKKRVGLDLSVYKTNTVNQIVDLPVSEASGYTRVFKNVGDVQNRGIEATLSLTPVKTESFSWDITANWAVNENKVVELAPGIDNYQLATYQGGVSVNAQVGKPYGIIQGSDYVYVNGQRVVDQTTGKYVISATNDKDLGTFTPKWTGGLNNRLTYKNVTMSFLIDVQKGGKVFSLDRWYGEGTGIYSNTVGNIRNPEGVVLAGVTPEGAPNTVAVDQTTGLDGYLGYLGSANSDYVYDASYVKLREVTLGYTFTKKALNNTFQDLYIGLSGTNLWIIDKNLPDADPESGLGSGNLQGFQSGVLPTTRTFALNLKAKF